MKSQTLQRAARFYLLDGHVQGVGFRPFVYRLATECGVHGWVENWMGQVAIHAEADFEYLQQFQYKLIQHAPPHAEPVISSSLSVAWKDYPSFDIHVSNDQAVNAISIVPDLPMCEECRSELCNKMDRRHAYAFLNCTNCGPRYTLIQGMPYDRSNTTMAVFPLCNDCQHEYETPTNRRFHAEPIACAECGPELSYRKNQQLVALEQQALDACVEDLKHGKIVAVKGVGGYHLMCDATNDVSIHRLRRCKPRPHKPLAVMMDEQQLNQHMVIDKKHMQYLNSSIHPILLLNPRPHSSLSKLIAPGLNELGVMLPYSPLHHLLLQALDVPLVATSANISGEPVLTDNQQVEQRLPHVAEAFLHHNRTIQRPADDSLFRIIDRKPRPLRLGRGVSPLELSLPFKLPVATLAVGGHMKNTIALAWGDRIIISPHIGDLDSMRSMQVMEQTVADFQQLYQIRAQKIVCDAHPSYSSTIWAYKTGLEVHSVYHHHAHASCLSGEYPDEKRWLVFTWDGAGYGVDDTSWGGEALLGKSGSWRRVASIRAFGLPGGDRAARAPWRSAAALCWEANEPWQAPVAKFDLAFRAWQRNINCPQSSAVGRVFDAAAALLNISLSTSYEGQAPMLLESLAEQGKSSAMALPLVFGLDGVWRTEWDLLLPMLRDNSLSVEDRARCFHDSMALALLHQALQIRDAHGEFVVGLSGGVFQNRLLTETVLTLLAQHKFHCYLAERIPCNDAGLCYGQIVESYGARQHAETKVCANESGIIH